MVKKDLLKLGLTEKEAEIYLISLGSGETTANRISDLAGLARSTTYDLLEKLKHKGFITTCVKDKKTHFLANNPEVLISFLEEKEKLVHEDYKDKKYVLKLLLPELKKAQNQINKKPLAEVFQGKVSVSKILDEIAENGLIIKIIGNQENAVKRIDYRTDKFRAKRKEKGSMVFQILEDSDQSRKEKTDKNTKVRFLKSLKESDDAIFIYDNTTVHLILAQEISAIRIKSIEYTKAQEINFDELWKIAKK